MLRFRWRESVSLVLGGGCERDTLPNDTLTSRVIARVSASCLKPTCLLLPPCCLSAACLLPACCLLLPGHPCLASHAWSPMPGQFWVLTDYGCLSLCPVCRVACKQPRMHGLVASTSLAVQFNCNQSYTSKDMQ